MTSSKYSCNFGTLTLFELKTSLSSMVVFLVKFLFTLLLFPMGSNTYAGYSFRRKNGCRLFWMFCFTTICFVFSILTDFYRILPISEHAPQRIGSLPNRQCSVLEYFFYFSYMSDSTISLVLLSNIFLSFFSTLLLILCMMHVCVCMYCIFKVEPSFSATLSSCIIFQLRSSGWITTDWYLSEWSKSEISWVQIKFSDFDHSLEIPDVIYPDEYLRVNYGNLS